MPREKDGVGLVLAFLLCSLADLAAAPVNDAFAARTPLTGDFGAVLVPDNYGATIEPDDPTPGDASLWWSWTAPESGVYTFTGTVDNYAPHLSIYVGSSLPNLVLMGTSPVDPVGIAGGRFSQVALEATEGVEYAIAISRRGGASGAGSLGVARTRPPIVTMNSPANGTTVYATDEVLLRAEAEDPDGAIVQVEFFAYWQGATRLIGSVTNAPFEMHYTFVYAYHDGGPQYAAVQARATDNHGVAAFSPGRQLWVTYPPPPNDAFSDRLPIAGSFFTVTGDNTYATLEEGDPSQGRGSVWWEWAAPASGVFRVTAVAHDCAFNPSLVFYSGASLPNLTPVEPLSRGASGQTCSAWADINAVTGARYVIGVSASSGFAGDLRLCFTPPEPPATAAIESIKAQPRPWADLPDAMEFQLSFTTGTGGSWKLESSTNLVVWQAIDANRSYPSNVRLDLETWNIRWRMVGMHDAVPYTVAPLFFRLALVPGAN